MQAFSRSFPMPSIKEYWPKERFSSSPPGKQIRSRSGFISRFDYSSDWSCRYEIDWPKKRKSMAIFGVDAVQVLNLALQTVGCELYASRYHADGTLVWTKPGDGYGYPVASGLRDQLVGADRN